MTQISRVAIVIILMFPAACFPTAIMVIRNGDNIAAAADSLVVTDSGPIHVCKIIQVQRCFFAASGSWNPSHGFDLLEIGRKACESGGTFAERVAMFHRLVKRPMLRYIAHDRKGNAAHYQHLVRDGVIEVVFFGNDNGQAVVIRTGYELDVKGEAIPFQEHSSSSQGDMFPLGETAAIQLFYRTQAGPEWYKLPIEEQVKRLVELEVFDKPAFVGRPISVVLSGPSVDRWIERGSCN